MAEIEWKQVSSDAFQEVDQERIGAMTATVKSESELAAELILDPLPLLIEGAGQFTYAFQVDDSWTVSLDRVNAEVPVGPGKGPRKIIIVFVLLPLMSQAVGVVYRVPKDAVQAA